MTAPINHRSTDTYPVTNNTRWTQARQNGETGVEVPASRASVFRVKPPAIPECPPVGSADVAYNLKVDSDGYCEWAEDAASVDLKLPVAPTADGDYKLHVASGVVTWVAITG